MMDIRNFINQSHPAYGMHDDNDADTRSEKVYREEGNAADTQLDETQDHSNFNSFNAVHSLPSSLDQASCVSNEDKECAVCRSSEAPMCHMKTAHLEKLKNSTKQLLCLLEQVQEKTHCPDLDRDDPLKLSDALKAMTIWDMDNSENVMNRSTADIIGSAALKRLEAEANQLDAIIIKNEDDDCSVYKRLTRKCHCLNQQEYNDFIIHFNEDTKYRTNSIGEIIKNMRIIKRFLYIGGTYTKNALLFLNQGLEEGSESERIEIVQACAFADLCCMFEPHTIVAECISWPCKNPRLMDPTTQELAAEFLKNLAHIEEGRRYLNFNSKIMCEIKKVLKTKQDKISSYTVEMLELVLELCQTPLQMFAPQSITTYQCRPTEEDIGNKTLNALMTYRRFMSNSELFLHLDILRSLSSNEEKKMELTPHLPTMITLFKNMLLEFNNSEMNLIITNIMNNIVRYNGENQRRIEGEALGVTEMLTACTATEAIKQKSVDTQMPLPYAPKKNTKKHPHHVRHRSRPALVIKKTDPNNKQVAASQSNYASQKSNQQLRQPPIPNVIPPKPNQTQSNASPLSSQGPRTKSAPFVNRSRKFEPSLPQLKETVTSRPRSTLAVYTTLNRSRKFMGGDDRNVIVVPMDEETTYNAE